MYLKKFIKYIFYTLLWWKIYKLSFVQISLMNCVNEFTVLFSGALLRVRQKWAVGLIDKMTTDISVVRGGWDPTLQQEIVDEYEYDGGNSSSRLFERSRIKALAGTELCRFSFSIVSFIYVLLQKTMRFVFIDYNEYINARVRNTILE